MSRRHRAPIPAGGFVRLNIPTLKSKAWRATSHGARSLYAALKMHYSNTSQNAVYLSTREAATQLGSNRTYIGRWFQELEFYGFIRQISPAYHGVGKGIAPHWRLTDEYHAGQPPTREFEKWDGQKFKSRGTSTGATLDPQVVPPLDPVVVPPTPAGGPTTGAIENAKGGPTTGAISSLPSGCGRVGVTAEGVAGIGHNAGPPLEDYEAIPGFLRRGLN